MQPLFGKIFILTREYSTIPLGGGELLLKFIASLVRMLGAFS